MSGPDESRPSGRTGENRTGDNRTRHGAVATVFACATPVAVVVLPTLPALVVTPLLAAASLGCGIGARSNARRSGGIAPGTATAITIGVLGLAMTLAVAPFWRPLTTYERCLAGANTVQDHTACREALDRGLTSRLPAAAPDLVDAITGLGN